MAIQRIFFKFCLSNFSHLRYVIFCRCHLNLYIIWIFFSGITFLIILGNIFSIRKLSIHQLYITYYLSYFVHIPMSIKTDFVWWTTELYISEMRKVLSIKLLYLLSTMCFEKNICVKQIFSYIKIFICKQCLLETH